VLFRIKDSLPVARRASALELYAVWRFGSDPEELTRFMHGSSVFICFAGFERNGPLTDPANVDRRSRGDHAFTS